MTLTKTIMCIYSF